MTQGKKENLEIEGGRFMDAIKHGDIEGMKKSAKRTASKKRHKAAVANSRTKGKKIKSAGKVRKNK
jgi:hypothetical protein